MKKRRLIGLFICAGIMTATGCGKNSIAQSNIPQKPDNDVEIQSEVQSEDTDRKQLDDHERIRKNISALGEIVQGAWQYTLDFYAEAEQDNSTYSDGNSTDTETSYDEIISDIDFPYVEINGNVPYFNAYDYTTETYYELSELDELGRCGTAEGCFGRETIAEGERGSIGHIKPSGWHTVKYAGIVDGNYLYNRCHLLMWKLSGILDDERNLITGTRYMNVEGMLPFEEELVNYVQSTGNHVLYRVTPDFQGDELVARGVYMEAVSVEDIGEGISFNVYCFNVQPGITIDYLTGESWDETSLKE